MNLQANRQIPFDDAEQIGPPLAVAGLFAGVGGIELGLKQAGHRSVMLCEIDESAAAVLSARFPGVPVHRDVTELDELPAETELVTAGFPCQDLSQAGRTKGIRGAKSGLVGEVFRLLRDRRPPWLLIENVPFMLHLARGEALGVIIAALDELGYRWAYRVVDSRAFGLPQRRRRVFLLASRVGDPRDVLYVDNQPAPSWPDKDGWTEAACGFYWTEGTRGLGWAYDAIPTLKGGSTVGVPSAPAIVLPRGRHPFRVGMPDIRDAERLQGFDPDWTKPAEAVGRASLRWKLVGNAVSVNAARWLGERLRCPGTYDGTSDEPLARGRTWPGAAYDVGGGPMVPTGLSEFPRFDEGRPLAEFLSHPIRPLSERAARGFHKRASDSTLNMPEGFLELIEEHIAALDARG